MQITTVSACVFYSYFLLPITGAFTVSPDTNHNYNLQRTFSSFDRNQKQSINNYVMCEPSSSLTRSPSSTSTTSLDAASVASSCISNAASAAAASPLWRSGGGWKRNLFIGTIGFVMFSTLLFATLYSCSMPFRRTVTFWRGMAPIYFEYKWLKTFRKPRLGAEAYEEELRAYYTRAADKLVALIMRLGGIATKVGQVLATVGQGILPDEIVVALRVLQDGVHAKSYDQVAKIITESTGDGKSMDEMFTWFSPEPLGAASIAQAHLARLNPSNETVVVKVQYPEIRQQLEADLMNMRMAVTLISPENRELADSLRERHTRELDFTLEADHLRECATNLQAHGVEPTLVRIPRVRNETGLCSENVLVMEYLEGRSLAKILEEEQARLARALGKSPGELQSYLTDQLKTIKPGGAQGDGSGHSALNSSSSRVANGKGAMRRDSLWANPTAQTVIQKTARVWTRMFRAYAGIRENVENVSNRLRGKPTSSTSSSKVNLSSVLKTLVHVHGLQMLLDGTYNADPHGGNVLVMPDGRLGLLDYGMIGRFSDRERYYASEAILALADGKVDETARIYTEGGYKAKSGFENINDPNILHRFATWHFDRIDLSPVKWASTGKSQDMMELLSTGVVELSVPKWIEDGRRLGALMMGPHIQSGRISFSLANSWKGIARRAQAEFRKNPDGFAFNQTGC